MSPNWKPPPLSQPENGYRFSADAFLLAGFAARFKPGFFLDLGAGSGVIAYSLSSQTGAAGVAVERVDELCRHARLNLEELPVSVIRADLRTFPWRKAAFDLAVCNPPYFSLGHGKISKNQAVALARHTFYGDVVAFAQGISVALKPHGRFCFIFPHDRAEGVLAPLSDLGWFVEERLFIHSYEDRAPRLQCLALTRIRVGRERISRLIMYRAHRIYTPEAVQLLELADEGCIQMDKEM